MVNTVTLNPAADRVLFLDRFEKNITNRVQDIHETVGGKGTHVSINLKFMGMNNRALGICHGETGLKIIGGLKEHGLDVRFLHSNTNNSRTNYLLVEKSGDSTLVAEPGVLLSEAEIQEFIQLLKSVLEQDDFLALSGDCSNCDPSTYARILRELEQKNLLVFLDTSGQALADCVKSHPFLIKPNLNELSFLCGRQVSNETEDVIDAIGSLEHYGIKVIAVSLGENGAVVKTPEGIFHAVPPAVNAINTVGCGDCFLAGLLFGFAKGLDVEDVLRVATASAAAAAESQSSVGFVPERATELEKQAGIYRL